jgi:hypothetical protein
MTRRHSQEKPVTATSTSARVSPKATALPG